MALPEELLFLRRARRVVSALPVLSLCAVGALLLRDMPFFSALAAGVPFLAAFLAGCAVLMGSCETASIPGKQGGLASEIFRSLLWGAMVFAAAWIFLPVSGGAMAFLSAVAILLALAALRKNFVCLRGDHISALMCKGLFPATLLWLLLAALLRHAFGA